MRILEIARTGFFKGLFPGDVARFDVDPYADRSAPGIRGLSALRREIASGRYDLIVCEPSYRSPWKPATLLRLVSNRRAFAGSFSLARAFGQQAIGRGVPTPIAVVDMEDGNLIERCDLPLLDACRFFFKRELPPDPWRVFTHTLTPRLPSRRFRSDARNRGRVAKLRPISLGLPPEMEPLLPIPRRDKTVDLFFAGAVDGLPLRERGRAELERLAAAGVVVDVPDRRLDRAAFYERCAAARLVWSPEGYGWDCFRHYEAAACGSVPLINLPTILRHRPLEEGHHALYYPPEPGGLADTVVAALRDRDRLVAMGEAAREHAVRFHRREALGRYVIDTCLGGASAAAADRPSGSQ